jgi:lysophospholipase L1-like esterase
VSASSGKTAGGVDIATAYTAAAAPTITPGAAGTNTASAIAGGVQVAYNSNKLRMKNAGGFIVGAAFPDNQAYLPSSKYNNTYAAGGGTPYAVEFFHDGQQLELWLKYFTAGGYRLRIDGRWVTDPPASIGGLTNGSIYKVLLDFGSRAVRRIQIDLYVHSFLGIYVGPGDTVWAPADVPGRMMVMGDSLSAGSAQNTALALGTWVDRAADLLGFADVWNSAIGGTGYITATRFLDRIGDLSAANWGAADLVVIEGGYNDSGGNSQQAIQDAARAFFQAVKAVQPAAQVIVLGVHSPSGSPAASLVNANAGVRAAALAETLAFVDQQSGEVLAATGATVRAATTSWVTGTGRVGTTTGVGNADVYIGTDGVHLTDAGHRYKARRVADAIQAIRRLS